jgi:hypothetical protein
MTTPMAGRLSLHAPSRFPVLLGCTWRFLLGSESGENVEMGESREVGYPNLDPAHVHHYEVVSYEDSAVAACIGPGCRSRKLARRWTAASGRTE